MADSSTTHYALTQPEVGGSPDTWGTKLNEALEDIDGLLFTIATVANAALPAASYSAADVKAKLLTVDGSGSGIDADLLDGQDGAFYTNASSMNAGTLATARMAAQVLRHVSGYTSGQVFVSFSDPSGGNDGDIWLKLL